MEAETKQYGTADRLQEESLQAQLATLHVEKQNLQQRGALQEGYMRQTDAALKAIRISNPNLDTDSANQRIGQQRKEQATKSEQRERLLGLEKRVYEQQHIESRVQAHVIDRVLGDVQSRIQTLLLRKERVEQTSPSIEVCSNDNIPSGDMVMKGKYPSRSLFEIIPPESDAGWTEFSDGESCHTDDGIKTPDEVEDDSLSQQRSQKLQPLITGAIARIRKASTPDAAEHQASIINMCPIIGCGSNTNDCAGVHCTKRCDRKSSNASQQQPHKRPRDGGDGDPGHDSSEDEDDERPRKNSAASSKDGAPCRRRLKCPYYQKDPWKHTRGSCRGVGFADMAKLKDHLKRVHIRPLQCTRCWHDMVSSEAYNIHLRAEPICINVPAPTEDDRLSPQTLLDLNFNRRPFAQAKTVSDKWTILFRIIFADTETIPSPYEEFGLNQGFDMCLAENICEELEKDIPPGFEHILDTIKGKIPDIIERSKKRARKSSRRSIEETTRKPVSGPTYQQAHIDVSPLTNVIDGIGTELKQTSFTMPGFSAYDMASTDTLPMSQHYPSSIFSTVSPLERLPHTSFSISSSVSSTSLTQSCPPQQTALRRRSNSGHLGDLYATYAGQEHVYPPFDPRFRFGEQATMPTPYPEEEHDPLLYGPVPSNQMHENMILGLSNSVADEHRGKGVGMQKVTDVADNRHFTLSGSEDYSWDFYAPYMQDMQNMDE